jgi:hypothetical protein
MEVREAEELQGSKSLCSNAELVVRQSAASKSVNTEVEYSMAFEAFTRQTAKTTD